MTKLTEHFTVEELSASPTAKRLGLSNTPTPEHLANMKYVCEKILEPVRAKFGPVTVNSSYRAPAVNKAVGGSKTSQHVNGQAVDFEVMGMSNKDLADWVADNLEFDQVILEFYTAGDKNSGWVHVSIKKEGGNRRQRLIATKSKAGGTKYTPVADFNPATTKEAGLASNPVVQEAVQAAVTPSTKTNPIAALQEKVGVAADGVFGPGTMKAAADYFKMSKNRAAHFFAQTAHETGNYKAFSENLNYSAEGLNKIFPKYFVKAGRDASAYSRNPEKIANVVYASRMGNGPESSGDGWKYRGRGALQLTGKSNYEAFAAYCGRPDVMTNPDLVAGELAFESALFFFERNKLWTVCDLGVSDTVILALTKKINGGTHGLDDRKAKTKKFYSQL